MRRPIKPTDQSALGDFCRCVYERLWGDSGRVTQPMQAPNSRVSQTTRGFFSILKPQIGTAPAAQTPQSIQAMPLYPATPFGNYWLCNDLPTLDGKWYRVAKPLDLWNTIASAVIDGITFTYNYNHNPANWDTVASYGANPDAQRFVRRVAQYNGPSGVISEYQAITPRYLPGQSRPLFAFNTNAAICQAVPADNQNSTGPNVTWMELSPRHWTHTAAQQP